MLRTSRLGAEASLQPLSLASLGSYKFACFRDVRDFRISTQGNVLSAKGNVLGERVLTACRSANGDFDGQNPEKTDLA